MTKKNINRLIGLVLGAVVISGAGIAAAGAKWTDDVYVNTAGRTGWGALGTARNTSNTTEYIRCSVSFSEAWSGGQPWVSCYARNAAGTSTSCGAYSQKLADVLHALNGDSYLYFTGNGTSTCSYIEVDNASAYEPKK